MAAAKGGEGETPLVFFLHPSIPGCRAVWCFVLETGLKCTLQEVNVAKREQDTKEFAALNPSRHLPCMIHGEFVLSEVYALTLRKRSGS